MNNATQRPKRLLSLLLALALLATLLPAVSIPAQALEIADVGTLTFDGMTLTGASDSTNVLSDCKASGAGDSGWGTTKTWYVSAGTLYLNNFECATAEAEALVISTDATINITGTNTISSTHTGSSMHAIYAQNRDLTIEGVGILNATTPTCVCQLKNTAFGHENIQHPQHRS